MENRAGEGLMPSPGRLIFLVQNYDFSKAFGSVCQCVSLW